MSRPACSDRPPALHVQAGNGAEQRGLAAAGGAEEGDELALPNLQFDSFQCLEGAEALGKAADPQEGRALHPAQLLGSDLRS
jgi:hypothetical protein